jgi:hypothetical protein
MAGEVKAFLGFVLCYGGFWLLIFLLCRLFFLGYHISQLAAFAPETVLGIFRNGLVMDLSGACYLTVLPYLAWVAGRFTPRRGVVGPVRVYTLSCITLVSLITVADLQSYQAYRAKLNAQTVAYLEHPKEALASVSSSPLALLLFLVGLLIVAGVLLYGKLSNGLYRGAKARHGMRLRPGYL